MCLRKLCVGLAFWFLLGSLPAVAQQSVLAPLYLSPLHWVDDTGQPVELAQWHGKPVFMTMAFSTCNRICPITVARLQELQRLLDKRSLTAEFVIISYDPINDSWQSWANYRKSYNLDRKNWHFLVGSPQDTKTVSSLLGMDYWLYDEHVVHDFNIVRLGVDGAIEKTLDWDSKERVDILIPESVPKN